MSLFIQLLIIGLMVGAGFGLMALGILLVYRTTRVLNLAHGAMAMFPAYISFQAHKIGLPVPLAVIAGIAGGIILGVGVERVLRPLRRYPAAQLMTTAALLLMLISIAVAVWSTEPRQAVAVFPDSLVTVQAIGVVVSWRQIGVALVSIAMAAGLTAVVNFTSIGLKLRAVAEDPEKSELSGVDSSAVSAIAWGAGAGMAAVAGILLSPLVGLHPYILTFSMVWAFAAALFGGLRSFSLTLAGGLILGVLYSEFENLRGLDQITGLREVAVFVAVVGFLALRGKQLGAFARE